MDDWVNDLNWSNRLFLKDVWPAIRVKCGVGDNDRNFRGQRAAFSLANKVKTKGDIKVTVYVPESAGTDWLDVVCGKQATLQGSA